MIVIRKWVYRLLLSFMVVSQGSAQELLRRPEVTRIYYDGSNNIEYVCTAYSRMGTHRWPIAAITSVVDAANTATVTTASAHGLVEKNEVTLSGWTTDTDLNGTYTVQTVGSTTTFTITTASVSDGTYNSGSDAGGLITTNAPLGIHPIWRIAWYRYASTLLAGSAYSKNNAICDNRAVTTGSTKVTYQ